MTRLAARRRVRAFVFAALALAGVGVLAGVAFAFWVSADSSNPAAAVADSVQAGATPSLVGVSAADVTISWPAASTTGGATVSGYTVARYSTASGGTPTAATGGCSGTVTALTCTEQTVPTGIWYYAITPKISLWAGAESARLSVTVDTTGPTGGTVAYTNGYLTTASVAVTVSNGTDSPSGVNAATTQLQRASTTLLNGSCGTFGQFADVGPAAPASPYADTTVVSGNCYQYRYVVADNLGNTSTFTSASVAKIDTSGPTFTVTSSGSNVYATGMTAYFKSAGTGSFTVTAVDAESGITSSTFPAAPLGWTLSGSGNARTYTLGLATTSSSIVVSTTNGAGTGSGNQTVTITVDITAPAATAGALAPIGNTTTQGFISQGSQYYIYATASDAGSGIANISIDASAITAGQTAVPLVAGSYTAFGTTYNYRSAAITATTPLVAGLKSYIGTLVDNVGNSITPGGGSATVDNTAPTGAITAPSNGGFAVASTTVTSSSADGTAGVASAQFQYSVHNAGSWTTIATDTASPYSITWDTTALTDGGSYDLRVVTTDNAANTFTSAIVTVTVDKTAPATPSTPVLAAASDSGVSGDNLTKVTTPTFTGTAEAGSTVKLFDGGTQVGSGTATGGNYSIAASALSTGAHVITATATDGAGNVSGASAGVTITIDTTAPAPTSAKLANGGAAGKADTGDTATFVYSEQLNAVTLCSAWSNSGTQTLNNATVTLTNNSGADTLTVTTPSCTFNFGSNNTQSNYVSATSTFTSSTITWNPATKSLTITLGTTSTPGNIRAGVAAAVQKYTPVVAISDLAGNAMAAIVFSDPTLTGF